MNNFLIAMDSFKGTMDAETACGLVEGAIRAHIADAHVVCLPMSDGGEGLTQACLRINGGQKGSVNIAGPFGKVMAAPYGVLANGVAVFEMAACAGLPLVGAVKDPLHATTQGVGDFLRYAEKTGYRQVLMGIGGSATNDCGIGMASALGYVFLDENGQTVAPLACNMVKVRHIQRPENPLKIKVTVACDVDNPLYGPEGATYVYGAQKGADEAIKNILDLGMQNMAEVINADLSVDVADMEGAGAAGGLGAGLVAFCGAELQSGVDLLLDTVKFDAMLEDIDVVFTGEGRIDGQSVRGKVPVGISRRCKKRAIPCIALCGSIGQGVEAVYEEGITAVFSAIRGVSSLEQIKETCKADLAMLADSVMRTLLCMV